jgi:hypothetical protein
MRCNHAATNPLLHDARLRPGARQGNQAGAPANAGRDDKTSRRHGRSSAPPPKVSVRVARATSRLIKSMAKLTQGVGEITFQAGRLDRRSDTRINRLGGERGSARFRVRHREIITWTSIAELPELGSLDRRPIVALSGSRPRPASLDNGAARASSAAAERARATLSSPAQLRATIPQLDVTRPIGTLDSRFRNRQAGSPYGNGVGAAI